MPPQNKIRSHRLGLLRASSIVILVMVGCRGPASIEEGASIQENRSWGQKTDFYEGEDQTFLQFLAGAHVLDEDPVEPMSLGDSALPIESLAEIGFQAQFALNQSPSQFGIETGISTGFWAGDAEFVEFGGGGGGGFGVVDLDSWLWTTEFSAGLFVSQTLWNRLRLYAGAGPTFVIGLLDTEDPGLESEDVRLGGSDVAVDLGAYVRGGAEIIVSSKVAVGGQVRFSKLDLEYDELTVGFDGLQWAAVISIAY